MRGRRYNVNTALLSQPLSDSELDALEVHLARFDSERAMNLEMSDGFFAALHCAPQVTPPSVFLPELWGGGEQDDDAFPGMEEYEAFASLVLRHWNDVGRRLSEDEAFLPSCTTTQRKRTTPATTGPAGFLPAWGITARTGPNLLAITSSSGGAGAICIVP